MLECKSSHFKDYVQSKECIFQKTPDFISLLVSFENVLVFLYDYELIWKVISRSRLIQTTEIIKFKNDKLFFLVYHTTLKDRASFTSRD